MVNRYEEIAEKMPWLKKKDVPRKPWDVTPQAESAKVAALMVTNKDDVINKIRTIQTRVNTLTTEKETLINDLERTRQDVNKKNNIISEKEGIINAKELVINEKDGAIKELETQTEALLKEKEGVEEKVSDLEKALKTATSEKLYLEQELVAADKALSEINNLLS